MRWVGGELGHVRDLRTSIIRQVEELGELQRDIGVRARRTRIVEAFGYWVSARRQCKRVSQRHPP